MTRNARTSPRRATTARSTAGGPRRATSLALPAAPAREVDIDQVHERIWSAIMDHSLPPETRLVESELCAIFGLGRTRMRQVLQRLAHERVVTLMRNRGAMVSRPTIEEAREVFGARRVVEAFLESAKRRDVKRLQDHLAREEEAWRTNDRRAMLKLSGDFHLCVAEAAGNSILTELLRDLVSRSSLIIAVYQSPSSRPCPPDAHRELLGMLERGERGAIRCMVQHIDHVMGDLRLEDRRDAGLDLRSVFEHASAVAP
jgi:DNA-binding GntR family transcriptional regulator